MHRLIMISLCVALLISGCTQSITTDSSEDIIEITPTFSPAVEQHISDQTSTSIIDLIGYWERTGDSLDGLIIEVSFDGNDYQGKILNLVSDMHSLGFKTGELKWTNLHVDSENADEIFITDLGKLDGATIEYDGIISFISKDEIQIRFLDDDEVHHYGRVSGDYALSAQANTSELAAEDNEEISGLNLSPEEIVAFLEKSGTYQDGITYDYSYHADGECYMIGTTSANMANIALSIASGSSEYSEQWETVCDVMNELCLSCLETVRLLGHESAHVCVMLRNDLSPDNILVSSYDGVIIFDATK